MKENRLYISRIDHTIRVIARKMSLHEYENIPSPSQNYSGYLVDDKEWMKRYDFAGKLMGITTEENMSDEDYIGDLDDCIYKTTNEKFLYEYMENDKEVIEVYIFPMQQYEKGVTISMESFVNSYDSTMTSLKDGIKNCKDPIERAT